MDDPLWLGDDLRAAGTVTKLWSSDVVSAVRGLRTQRVRPSGQDTCEARAVGAVPVRFQHPLGWSEAR